MFCCLLIIPRDTLHTRRPSTGSTSAGREDSVFDAVSSAADALAHRVKHTLPAQPVDRAESMPVPNVLKGKCVLTVDDGAHPVCPDRLAGNL